MGTKFTLRQYLLIAASTFIITLVVMLTFSFIIAQLGLSENVQQTLRGVLLFTILLTAPLVQNRFRKMADEAANSESK
jgi:chromate transport protein ChrA